MRVTLLRCLVWLPLVLVAAPAYAHAPIPGIKGFYVGLLHPFSTPSQALLMLGMGLLAGFFVVDKARWFLSTFLGATLLGVFFGSADWELDPALYATSILACLLAALVPGKLTPIAVFLTAVGGVLIGIVSITDAGLTQDRVITMSGSIVGANIGLLYLWGFTHFVQDQYTWPWVMIAFRVAAAWIGAIALLMLALYFAPTPAPA